METVEYKPEFVPESEPIVFVKTAPVATQGSHVTVEEEGGLTIIRCKTKANPNRGDAVLALTEEARKALKELL